MPPAWPWAPGPGPDRVFRVSVSALDLEDIVLGYLLWVSVPKLELVTFHDFGSTKELCVVWCPDYVNGH